MKAYRPRYRWESQKRVRAYGHVTNFHINPEGRKQRGWKPSLIGRFRYRFSRNSPV